MQLMKQIYGQLATDVIKHGQLLCLVSPNRTTVLGLCLSIGLRQFHVHFVTKLFLVVLPKQQLWPGRGQVSHPLNIGLDNNIYEHSGLAGFPVGVVVAVVICPVLGTDAKVRLNFISGNLFILLLLRFRIFPLIIGRFVVAIHSKSLSLCLYTLPLVLVRLTDA